MDIKPLFKNRVFQALAVTAVAAGVLTFGVGLLVGAAVKWAAIGGAGYLAYKYVVEPMISGNSSSQTSKEILKKYNNHYYDADEVNKRIMTKIKNSKTFKR